VLFEFLVNSSLRCWISVMLDCICLYLTPQSGKLSLLCFLKGWQRCTELLLIIAVGQPSWSMVKSCFAVSHPGTQAVCWPSRLFSV